MVADNFVTLYIKFRLSSKNQSDTDVSVSKFDNLRSEQET